VSKILHLKTINSKNSTFSIKVSTWRIVFNDNNTICIIYINETERYNSKFWLDCIVFIYILYAVKREIDGTICTSELDNVYQ